MMKDKAPDEITPGIRVDDPVLVFWLSQVNLRVRREVCWAWQQRVGHADPHSGALPPVTDAAAANLDLVRYVAARERFFTEDPAASFLTEKLAELEEPVLDDPARGSWTWLAKSLGLNPAEQFVFALAIAHHLDSGLGPIFATCMNDLSRPFPTVALAQRLWSDPSATAACASAFHVLFRYGMLLRSDAQETGMDWQRPLVPPAAVVRLLGGVKGNASWEGLQPVAGSGRVLDEHGLILAGRLAAKQDQFTIVPLLGRQGSDYGAWAKALSEYTEVELMGVDIGHVVSVQDISIQATLAWMRGCHLVMPEAWLPRVMTGNATELSATFARLAPLPVLLFVPAEDHHQFASFPSTLVAPSLQIPQTTFSERVALWGGVLGQRAEALHEEIEECARRFRLPELTIRTIGRSLSTMDEIDRERLFAACRIEAGGIIGDLAVRVTPRFEPGHLVLGAPQAQQYKEILNAMDTLTKVHYQWGTARAWNESGLAVLFCGSPGTGKTMAAESLAVALDLDMYRVDLSQVVNKYVGETEKNLKRIFDSAEASDCILFFDEADALFGKRTEVKDAHDRFANIEISYLLERMERFKGLAILATNRRKDLDEAFMRRLRYVIEFPVPDNKERERIWRQVFPDQIETSELDFSYLARQFALAGGHIRSVSFNACLQAATRKPDPNLAEGKVGAVTMEDVLVQIKRELQKTSRASDSKQFGKYGPIMEKIAV